MRHPRAPSLPALLALGVAVLLWFPFLSDSPNRLLSGQGVALTTLWAEASRVWRLGFGLAAAVLAAACLWPQHQRRTLGALLLALAGLLIHFLLLAGQHAQALNTATQSLGRTSLGSGFWLALLVLWLLANEALRLLQASLALKTCTGRWHCWRWEACWPVVCSTAFLPSRNMPHGTKISGAR